MLIRSYCLLFGVALLSACGASENPGASRTETASAAVAPDLEAIAKSIVTRTAEVKEGDVVAIFGSVRDLELLENIAVNVMAVGGKPMVGLTSERLLRRSYDDVPEKYDTTRPVWNETVSATADVIISVDMFETPDLLANVPRSRIAARAKAELKAGEISARRGVRFIDIGNGLYPTHARASQLGISRDELAKFFWSSLAADFSTLEQNAERVKAALKNAHEIHVTTPSGTNVRFRLRPGAKLFESDGTIPSVEEVGKGVFRGAYLPAGEVYTLIEPGSGEGKIVVDELPYRGKLIKNVVIDVSKGRMTGFSAPAGTEGLKAEYDAASEGRDLLSVIDFGINPGISNTAGTSLRSWVPAGTVTVIFGSDFWAGGSNRTNFSLNPFLTDATATVDGRVIVRDGKLVI